MSERRILTLMSLDFRHSIKGDLDNKKLILGRERIWSLEHNGENDINISMVKSKTELINIIKLYASLKVIKEVK